MSISGVRPSTVDSIESPHRLPREMPVSGLSLVVIMLVPIVGTSEPSHDRLILGSEMARTRKYVSVAWHMWSVVDVAPAVVITSVLTGTGGAGAGA